MNRLPALLLTLALIGAATTIVATIGLLPPVVPSHFGFDGRPDRWTPRDAYVVVMLLLAIGLPLLIVASMGTVRGIPVRWINLPNRDYWLAPSRREETYRTLRAFGCCVGVAVALFLTAMHVLIVTGTFAREHASPNTALFALLAVFLLCIVLMLVWLARRFARPG
jgi:serine/threonine-protein kinase